MEGCERLTHQDAAKGQATVHNNSGFPVYLYACSQTPATCIGETTLGANGDTYAETFLDSSTGGRSINLSCSSSTPIRAPVRSPTISVK